MKCEAPEASTTGTGASACLCVDVVDLAVVIEASIDSGPPWGRADRTNVVGQVAAPPSQGRAIFAMVVTFCGGTQACRDVCWGDPGSPMGATWPFVQRSLTQPVAELRGANAIVYTGGRWSSCVRHDGRSPEALDDLP
jgi:hypothetical protein